MQSELHSQSVKVITVFWTMHRNILRNLLYHHHYHQTEDTCTEYCAFWFMILMMWRYGELPSEMLTMPEHMQYQVSNTVWQLWRIMEEMILSWTSCPLAYELFTGSYVGVSYTWEFGNLYLGCYAIFVFRLVMLPQYHPHNRVDFYEFHSTTSYSSSLIIRNCRLCEGFIGGWGWFWTRHSSCAERQRAHSRSSCSSKSTRWRCNWYDVGLETSAYCI